MSRTVSDFLVQRLSAYVQTMLSPLQARHLVDRALRIALAERTVTCLIVPHDLQSEAAVEEPPHTHGTIHSGIGFSRPRVVPAAGDPDAAGVMRQLQQEGLVSLEAHG